MVEIETAVGRYLTTRGVCSLDEGGVTGDTFLGNMPSEPDLAIMLKPTGGMALANELEYDEPTLQVMVRAAQYDRSTARQRLSDIYGELVGLRAVTLDPGGSEEVYVVRVLALQSAPADLGLDDNERPQFSQNFAFHVRNPTQHRP